MENAQSVKVWLPARLTIRQYYFPAQCFTTQTTTTTCSLCFIDEKSETKALSRSIKTPLSQNKPRILTQVWWFE